MAFCCTAQRVFDDEIVCVVLKNSMQDSIFFEDFKIKNLQSDSILFFDLNNQIPECSEVNKLDSKSIKIINTSSSKHSSPNSIIIYSVEYGNSTIKMSFFRPYSGAALRFNYKIDQGKMELINIERGAF